jgi:hypothetical protein
MDKSWAKPGNGICISSARRTIQGLFEDNPLFAPQFSTGISDQQKIVDKRMVILSFQGLSRCYPQHYFHYPFDFYVFIGTL